VAPLVYSGVAASRKSVERKPEMTKNSGRDTAPKNRKQKEKRKAEDINSMIETKLEDGNSKQEIISGLHTILNVPHYAQITEPHVSDVTQPEESLPIVETYR